MIREFWREAREERKEQKRLRKESKKRKLTGEQKAYRVFGILLTIFLIFGSFFYACRGWKDADLSGLKWNEVLKIDDDIVEGLNVPIDTNLLYVDGKIENSDLVSMQNKWVLAGGDEAVIKGENSEADENALFISSKLTLTDKELGAFCRDSNEGISSAIEILNLKIYEENGEYYLTSLVYCKLGGVIGISDFPNVYLKSVAEVKKLENQLVALSTSVYINQLDERLNEKLVDKIELVAKGKLKTACTDLIVSYINTIYVFMNADMKLVDGGIEFSPLAIN